MICTLHDFLSSKARFIDTSTVTESHSCFGKLLIHLVLLFQLEGSIGYAHWVCKTLKEGLHMDKELFKYSIEQMSAIPAASDALIKYTGQERKSQHRLKLTFLLLQLEK